MSKNLSLKVPFHMEARDYHHFHFIQDVFEEAGVKLNYEEVGCDGNYHAVFYAKGTKTSRPVKKMIKQWEDAIEEYNDYDR